NTFADKLMHAAEKMESRDKDLGELYKILNHLRIN
ncbi:hypothetical protein HMPREF9986_06441, partial [Staphylococcus epidermidis NIHLM040]